MMDACPVRILGFGASTPIGRSLWASAAAARAGVCGFSEHPFMIDTAGEPMRVARAGWIDETIDGIDRYYALLVPAVDEALAAARDHLDSTQSSLALALALPPPRPGRPDNLGDRLIDAIANRYPRVFADTSLFECGHAAGYLALDSGVRRIAERSLDACLVAGVDSYLPPETLEWLEASDQLHGGGALNNAWGFIPGEAAGAMLVSSVEAAPRTNPEIYGDVIAVGIGRETNLIKTNSVCIGEGLTEAFRAALAGLAPEELVQDVFCDLNGETYRADEYGFTALRTKERFRAATDFIAPADCWGDIGAAGAPLHAGLALISARKGYANGPVSIVWGSSESGERGAAVLRAAIDIAHWS
jgi:3-oxoacyl-[acyl-carrier-protein] synthase-1